MKRLMLLAVLLFSFAAVAQNCNSIVIDEAGVIKNTAIIEKGVAPLIDLGADVHVITVSNIAKYGNNLTDVETSYEKACPSWMAPSNAAHRKANLLVMMVAPTQRKKNTFFGDAYVGALPNEDVVNTLYSKNANSFFKAGQWEEGFAASAKGFADRIAAYHDEQQHPATTNVAATDMQPVAHSFNIFLLLLFGAGIIGLIIWLIVRYGNRREEVSAAQDEAINAQQRASNAFAAADKNAVGYGVVASRFVSMSNSLRLDPSEEGLTAAAYSNIANQWDSLAQDIEGLSDSPTTEKPKTRAAAATASKKQTKAEAKVEKKAEKADLPTHSTHNTTNNIIAPIVVNEEREESYHSSSHSSSSDDDSSSSSSSGSDSSWGSSSSSDWGSSSGSDSSFGSSDFGGGGGGSDSSF